MTLLFTSSTSQWKHFHLWQPQQQYLSVLVLLHREEVNTMVAMNTWWACLEIINGLIIVIFSWHIKRTLWWTKPQSFYSMNVGLPIYSTNLLTFQGSRNALLACSRECACLVQVQTQTRNWEQLGHPFHHSIPEYTRANKTQALSCRLNPIPHGGRRDIWHQLLSLKPTLICIYGTWD